MSCSCCTSSIVDGQILQSEYDHKVFNLQCRFKDYVANITNKWRYGIFCPEDSETIVEIRALLRLLICYGTQVQELPPDSSNLPSCYTDYLDNGGTDLNELLILPLGATTNDLFFVTSPFTGNYYIFRITGGLHTFSPPITTLTLIYQFDAGLEVIARSQAPAPVFIEVECSGTQVSLDDAITASQGVTVYSRGLADSDIFKIVERIEKLLEC
jgi:hypothetical protein